MSSPRILLCCCLIASVSFPALGGTWTPDPSLGNVDQHRHLYEIGRAYGDANFDPDANLLGVHTKNPPNKKQHATRESAYYAYGLLMTGDPADQARAQAILKRIVTLQDTTQGSPTCGAYNWNAEDKPGDLNSAVFVGLTLANIIDLDRKRPCLDSDVRSAVENSARLAVAEVMTRNVEPGYTNIALLSTAFVAAAQKLWQIPGAGDWAQAKLDAVVALTGDGELSEYLSPTYNGVAFQGAYLARKYSISDAFGAKVDALIGHMWKQVALAYHAPTYQLGGPYLRAYGDNMLDYCAALKYFLYFALDGAYPIPDAQFDHDWDMGGLTTIADLPVTVRPEFKQPPVPWRQWDANGEDTTTHPTRHLSQYQQGNFTLGTVAMQDEWKQKRNLVAFWRNDGPPPLGFSVGLCIDESCESIPGFPGEKIHFYSQQVKDAALVELVTSADVPAPGCSTLVFDSGAVVGDTSATPLVVKDGTMTAYIYPVSNVAVQYNSTNSILHHADSQADTGQGVVQVTRPWSSADSLGSLHALAYLIVFRPSDQPAPTVTNLVLSGDESGVSAGANVDGTNLSVSSKN
ncbi:MAG: hypothetical protein LV481_07460 [Methylacidiphilales bacterium]|nr:hypothetical protein [Candidatus Methylacidiphilales bacterium]